MGCFIAQQCGLFFFSHIQIYINIELDMGLFKNAASQIMVFRAKVSFSISFARPRGGSVAINHWEQIVGLPDAPIPPCGPPTLNDSVGIIPQQGTWPPCLVRPA